MLFFFFLSSQEEKGKKNWFSSRAIASGPLMKEIAVQKIRGGIY
jgi:hypothetical protein